MLKSDLVRWNKMREDNPALKPELVDVDLSGTDLRGANLSYANLNLSVFNDAHLEGVNFEGASLNGAVFDQPDLSNANLVDTDLSEAILSGAELYDARIYMTDFYKADLSYSNFSGKQITGHSDECDFTVVNFEEADLYKAKFERANLPRANFYRSNLERAIFREANLYKANLSEAQLEYADLWRANLEETNFSKANLSHADLSQAILIATKLHGATLNDAMVGWTNFCGVDFCSAKGIETAIHSGPSSIGLDTLAKSNGFIPEVFLEKCGVAPWEIEFASLYDQTLSAFQIEDILATKIFQKRSHGPLSVGGVFISYSHSDSVFADKLYKALQNAKISVWLDRHDMLAGDMQRQVVREIRLRDIVIIVLSKKSVESDWVESELEIARQKEKNEKRDVLCPVSLDESWKKKDSILWLQLKRSKNVIDFSKWKTKNFQFQFEKLFKGIKINYERIATIPRQ